MAKIMGLMVARDEEICVGMTIETAKDIIDELVFVDNSSIDRTHEIVRDRCKEYNIPLHEYSAPLTMRLPEIRMMAYNKAREIEGVDWFFTCDADMVFLNTGEVRKLIDTGYEQFWFRTLNLYGEPSSGIGAGMNIPHMWLFKNKPGIAPGANYCVSETTHKKDPNTQRFLGWNLNGLKTYEHIFWRFQIWFMRAWNAGHGTSISVTDFIKLYFGGKEPTDEYKKSFVLNRMHRLSFPHSEVCKYVDGGISLEEFTKKYLCFPPCLKNLDTPYRMILNDEGRVIGREPDLVGVPLLSDDEIYQLSPPVMKMFRDKKFD